MSSPRHLLSVNDLSRDEIESVLHTAESFADISEREVKKLPTLRGRTVVNLFYENSTRTRVSFEIAAKRLSADVINFSAAASSVQKGESLKDTALTLRAMGADAMVVRHPSPGAPALVARWAERSVVNAGDGAHEHPTQAMLDLFTVKRKFGSLEGLRIAIVGDVAHSRVARSGAMAFTRMGASVILVGPPTLMPPGALGCEVSTDLDGLLPTLDVVYMLRLQRERQDGYFIPGEDDFARMFALTRERAGMLPQGAAIMHAGPMNRGVEITTQAAESPAALIEDQVAAGVAVRMALLYLILGGPP